MIEMCVHVACRRRMSDENGKAPHHDHETMSWVKVNGHLKKWKEASREGRKNFEKSVVTILFCGCHDQERERGVT